MGLACSNCKGMGRLFAEGQARTGRPKGPECPVCVGGQSLPTEYPELTPPFVPPVGRPEDLPPSTATPDGRVSSAVTQTEG